MPYRLDRLDRLDRLRSVAPAEEPDGQHEQVSGVDYANGDTRGDPVTQTAVSTGVSRLYVLLRPP